MSESRPWWPALAAVVMAIGITLVAVKLWTPAPSSVEPLPGEPLLREALALVREHSVLRVDMERLGEGAVSGMVGAVDRYAQAYDPEQWEIFRQHARGAFTGIGLDLVTLGDRTLVADVLAGSPSSEAGIRPGERLLSIDGQVVQDAQEAERALDGPVGSRVALLVASSDGADARGTSVPRRDLDRPTVYSTRIDDTTALIVITEFRPTTPAQFDAAWKALSLNSSPRLLVDLRNNHGGDLDAAAAVADRWIDKGVIYRRVGRTTESECLATEGAPLETCQTVLLINGETASAAEVLAGALADHGRAVLVGERTYGKGAIQEVMPFATSPGGMKITTGMLLTPSGRPLESHLALSGRGIGSGGLLPDVVVKVPPTMKDSLERARHRGRWPAEIRNLVERYDGVHIVDATLDTAKGLLR